MRARHRRLRAAAALVARTLVAGTLGVVTLGAQVTMVAGARSSDETLRLVLRDHAARGLPVAPLSAKVAEGRAKGAPDERIVAAVALLAARLDTAARALGPAVTDGELREGAEALGAGASPAMLTRLKARAKARSVEPALVVLTRLLRRGVDTRAAERAVARLIDKRLAPTQLMATADEILRDVEAGRGLGESVDTRLGPIGTSGLPTVDGANIPFPGGSVPAAGGMGGAGGGTPPPKRP